MNEIQNIYINEFKNNISLLELKFLKK